MLTPAKAPIYQNKSDSEEIAAVTEKLTHQKPIEHFRIQRDVFDQLTGIEKDFAAFLIHSGRWILVGSVDNV